ncbi:penicillin-insensitive murein endopeptidase [Allomesorhizobium camelthorni]|uniref:Penicillin-insensitive murein endopeptidase n=1 Tax=Allomesorhizobium camelthorni TaxID=475069 RepID=A0A6G4W5H6_9HYPH|nr:penicillin-insensitive murein endopeptidase [Mesorhizobium camelthorni]NGO50001.1 penicillin-insensitive murein endopeptidase [Mesorhizobium camelthorni]
MKSLFGWGKRLAIVAAAALAVFSAASPQAGAEQLAKILFGSQKLPAATTAKSYGFYSKGCFSGGLAIATDGPTWQAMRLSRNRRWGHPTMIRLLEKLSRDAVADGWPGLLLGDISQPRGGPMLTGHASHQIGLDADIWLTPMPDRRLSATERENVSAISVIKKGGLTVDERIWTAAHARLLRRAASYGEVERILVHPGIKKKLCETVKGDRGWLRKVRPFWGHDYHFHIRIGCQPGSNGCKQQAATARGDGCDASLAWWFTEEPWRPSKNPDAPKARDLMTMNSLPKECRAVLEAPAPVSEAAVTVGGGGTAVAAAPAETAPAESITIETIVGAPPIAASAFAPTPNLGVPLPRPRPAD